MLINKKVNNEKVFACFLVSVPVLSTFRDKIIFKT